MLGAFLSFKGAEGHYEELQADYREYGRDLIRRARDEVQRKRLQKEWDDLLEARKQVRNKAEDAYTLAEADRKEACKKPVEED